MWGTKEFKKDLDLVLWIGTVADEYSVEDLWSLSTSWGERLVGIRCKELEKSN